MSKLTDKISYLQGLAEGMKLNPEKDSNRLIQGILEVQGDKYALLVPTCEDDEEEEGHCHCHDHNHEEDDDDAAFFAKIVLDESGEEAYIEPTDEEFEAVLAAYEALMDEEENED